MTSILVLSVPMALLWMIFANQFSVPGLIVGYIFGFGVLMVIRLNTRQEQRRKPIQLRQIPGQMIALLIYIARLAWDVLLSGIDVGWRVIQPKMPVDPAVQTISTQDPDHDWLVSALSAHSITITPGELVIDFEEGENGETLMLIHTLDQQQSNLEKLQADQTERLKIIRQILGMQER